MEIQSVKRDMLGLEFKQENGQGQTENWTGWSRWIPV